MCRMLFSPNMFAPIRSSILRYAKKYSSSGEKPQLQRFTGKVAVLTASTDGIGFSIAQRLASEGAKVVVSSRNIENVNRAVDQLKTEGYPDVIGVKCHVGNADDREHLFVEAVNYFGGVDIFVSNAGVNPAQMHVLNTSESAWDKIFDINLKSSFLLAQKARLLMLQRGGGSIVFMSSISAYYPFQTLGAYSVSKTALLALTKTAAMQCATENIRVNCVAPGIIETNFSQVLYKEKEIRDSIMATIWMKYLGKCEQISGVVAFLVSEDASYITGETIVVAGGMQSRM